MRYPQRGRIAAAGAAVLLMAASTMTVAAAEPALTWTPVELPGTEAWLLDTGDGFIATDQDNRTFRSDDGLTWTEFDLPGTVVDAYDGALLSQDPGSPSFTLRHRDGAESNAALPGVGSVRIEGNNGVNSESAFGPAGIVLVACGAECMTSTVWHSVDGEAWQQVYQAPSEGWEVVTATADGFVARTDRNGDFTLLYSTDGVEWTRINTTGYDRYDVIGAAPWGAVVRKPTYGEPDYLPTDGTLAVATADGLAELTLPADIAPLMADGGRWRLGAGGLGVVGIDVPDRRVLFSPDGIDWTLEPLPGSVPRLLEGRMGGGRPSLHVGKDAVLMSTYVCVQPDGTEVDCQETEDEVVRQVWWRGTPG